MIGWLLKLAGGNVGLIWAAVGIAVASAAAGGSAAWAIQGWRLDAAKGRLATVQAAFDTFKAGVAAEGLIAQEKAAAKTAADKLKKENADAENLKASRDMDRLYAAYRSLRDARASSGSGLLPATTPGAPDPNRICFDRAQLARGLAGADGILQEGALQLLRRCDKAIIDLDTARRWAQQ